MIQVIGDPIFRDLDPATRYVYLALRIGFEDNRLREGCDEGMSPCYWEVPEILADYLGLGGAKKALKQALIRLDGHGFIKRRRLEGGEWDIEITA